MIRQQLNKIKIPDAPGVYFFKKGGETLYIGKATSLRDRVKSYFSSDLISSRGPRIVDMIALSDAVEFQTTDSVLEALLLEAELIRKKKPTYNVLGRDDKSFNCVVITDEDFPAVLVMRKKDVEESSVSFRRIFGPFPNGSQLREAMRIIRKIFPYRDEKCFPPVKGVTSRACFNAQIGLCPGVCAGLISNQDYQNIIRDIELLFAGKKALLVRQMTDEMNSHATREEFEQAAIGKKRIEALGHIQDVALIKRDLEASNGFRIEAYDIAHFAGKSSKGVVTVVIDGDKSPRDYRTFNLKRSRSGSDTDALGEIIDRRLSHSEWPYPRLMVVDGGKAQLNAAVRVLKSSGFLIPVVAVTKDERHQPKAIIGDQSKIKGREYQILLANAEAHRFSIRSHRVHQRKSFVAIKKSTKSIKARERK